MAGRLRLLCELECVYVCIRMGTAAEPHALQAGDGDLSQVQDAAPRLEMSHVGLVLDRDASVQVRRILGDDAVYAHQLNRSFILNKLIRGGIPRARDVVELRPVEGAYA